MGDHWSMDDADCRSCPEVMPTNECPNSQRPCGHHCNHSWEQDICHWCGQEFSDDVELVAVAESVTPTTVDRRTWRQDARDVWHVWHPGAAPPPEGAEFIDDAAPAGVGDTHRRRR